MFAKVKTAETLKSLAVHSRFKTSYVSFRRPTPGRPPRIPRHVHTSTPNGERSQGISPRKQTVLQSLFSLRSKRGPPICLDFSDNN
jgi:hypothetical protein